MAPALQSNQWCFINNEREISHRVENKLQRKCLSSKKMCWWSRLESTRSINWKMETEKECFLAGNRNIRRLSYSSFFWLLNDDNSATVRLVLSFLHNLWFVLVRQILLKLSGNWKRTEMTLPSNNWLENINTTITY